MNYCVVTTVNKPSKAIEKLYSHFGSNLIIVGDEKTPSDWRYKNVAPLTVLGKRYAPNNHYARKNLGYLHAIKNKATLIYDCDDDTWPNENWEERSLYTIANESSASGWFNVYDAFSEKLDVDRIWPRGFSLRRISDVVPLYDKNKKRGVHSSIQQGLVNGDPDVDAIWRLAFGGSHEFKIKGSICLQPYSWCPFNSQSTWWFSAAFPLMYLPVHSTFRMCDIWRSFIAQRCIWELGEGVTFHSPAEVFQDRNEHDLLKDFADEVPGYLNNDTIVSLLSGLVLMPGEQMVCRNLLTCYAALVEINILPVKELMSVTEWIKDYEIASGNL